jgi:hypothetical protein
MIYLMTPGAIYFLVKNRTRIWSNLRKDDVRLFALASVVPLCVFAVVSFKKVVGPHWYVCFVPFAYVVVACVLDPQQIVKSISAALVLTLIQVSAFLAAPLVPVDKLKGLVEEEDLASLVIYEHPKSVLELLEQYGDDFVLATTSYSTSALLEFYHGDRVIVFGKGTHHARQDDILTNFKELEGRNILILHKKRVDPDAGPLYEACFDRIETRPLKIRGATFVVQFGYGFKYAQYRERHLRRALQGYYQIPDWLPHSKNFFREKYDF